MNGLLLMFLVAVLVIVIIVLIRFLPPLFSAAPRPREIFVASAGSDCITVFGLDLQGFIMPAPLRVIFGQFSSEPDATALDHPWDVTVESSGRVFVLNAGSDAVPATISVFPADSQGNIAPEGTYPGPNSPTALALRRSPPALMVTSIEAFGGQISELPRDPRNGLPTGALGGGPTVLQVPAGIAVDGGNVMYVAETVANRILIFATYHPGSNVGTPPTRVISGPHTLLDQPVRIALGADGQIYVTNRGNGSIAIFDPNADGDAAPVRRIGGPASLFSPLAQPFGIDVDDVGRIFVADGNALYVFAAGADGDVLPVQAIEGDDVNHLSLTSGVAFHVPQG